MGPGLRLYTSINFRPKKNFKLSVSFMELCAWLHPLFEMIQNTVSPFPIGQAIPFCDFRSA
jgi:hypothetical protein